MARPIEISDDEIIKVTKQLFFRNGIGNTEMKEIAKNCGIGRSSLYRHYQSKEAIAFVVSMEIIDEMYLVLQDGLREHSANGFESVSNALSAFADYCVARIDNIRFLDEFDSIFSTYPKIKETEAFGLSIRKVLSTELNQYICKGMKDHSFRQVEDPEFTGMLLLNAILAIAQRVLPRQELLKQEQGHAIEYIYALKDELLSAFVARD